MMRNLLLAALAVTAFGCESCWEKRESAPEAVAAPPDAAEAVVAAPAPRLLPPPLLAAPKTPEELAREREMEKRRSSNPMSRFEPRQVKLGGKTVSAKPSVHFRPIRERPAAAMRIPTAAKAPAAGGAAATPAPAAPATAP